MKIKIRDESSAELGHVIKDVVYSRRLNKVITAYKVKFWVW